MKTRATKAPKPVVDPSSDPATDAFAPATRRLAIGAVVVTVVLWSTNFPVIRYAVQVYPPEHIALLRLAFASIFLGLYALAVRMPFPPLRDWPIFLFFGLTGMALSSLGLAFGLDSVSAGAGSFIIGTLPVFSAILAGVFLAERIGRLGWMGIALSFSGVAIIGLGESSGFGLNWGVVLLMASALFQSVFYVFQKPYLGKYTPMQMTCYAVWGGTICLIWLAPYTVAEVQAAPLGQTFALAYQGLFPTGFAFAFWSYALTHLKAANVTSAIFLMPVFSFTLAYFWLGEVPTTLSVLGGMVAIGGVLVLNFWGK